MHRFWSALGRLLSPEGASTRLGRERWLTRLALPVFGISMLSTVVYAPDAVVDALRGGNQAGAIPAMAGAVVGIMLLLALAYRSHVRARPDASGDYQLVREELGPRAGIFTGAALLVDYFFTVSVSVSAAAAVLAHVVPWFGDWQVVIALLLIGLLALGALRGSRTQVRLSVFGFFALLAVVVTLLGMGALRAALIEIEPLQPGSATVLTALVAYAGAISSGAVMVTGMEHLAVSGPYHKAPRGVRAGRTVMIATLAAAGSFFAVAWLAWTYRVTGWVDGPVVLQVAERVAGDWLAWIVAGVAIVVLYAASSTTYRRFTTLTAALARDGYLPSQLTAKTDEQVIRGGVAAVSVAAAIVVIATGADIERLIHMYVVGVFVAIVLGQIGMIRLMSKRLALATAPGRIRRLALTRLVHVIAAIVSIAVWAVVLVFNFFYGAWATIATIVLLVVAMLLISRHYAAVNEDVQLREEDGPFPLPSSTHGVVLVLDVNKPALRALSYARAARHSTIEALAVVASPEESEQMREAWMTHDPGVKLVMIDAPTRDLITPVLDYVTSWHRRNAREVVVVYVPEFIVGRWWETFLHNRESARLRALLLDVPGVVVSAVPWQLSDDARS